MLGRNSDQVLRRDLEIGRHGMIGTKPLQLGDMVTMEILEVNDHKLTVSFYPFHVFLCKRYVAVSQDHRHLHILHCRRTKQFCRIV